MLRFPQNAAFRFPERAGFECHLLRVIRWENRGATDGVARGRQRDFSGPWAQHIPALMATAHVVVLPNSYREGVPRSLIEAAAGLSIVTTGAPGCREVVEGGQRHSRARARWCGTGGSDSKACPGSGTCDAHGGGQPPEKSRLMPEPLTGKTIGIVGLGTIGTDLPFPERSPGAPAH